MVILLQFRAILSPHQKKNQILNWEENLLVAKFFRSELKIDRQNYQPYAQEIASLLNVHFL